MSAIALANVPPPAILRLSVVPLPNESVPVPKAEALARLSVVSLPESVIPPEPTLAFDSVNLLPPLTVNPLEKVIFPLSVAFAAVVSIVEFAETEIVLLRFIFALNAKVPPARERLPEVRLLPEPILNIPSEILKFPCEELLFVPKISVPSPTLFNVESPIRALPNVAVHALLMEIEELAASVMLLLSVTVLVTFNVPPLSVSPPPVRLLALAMLKVLPAAIFNTVLEALLLTPRIKVPEPVEFSV